MPASPLPSKGSFSLCKRRGDDPKIKLVAPRPDVARGLADFEGAPQMQQCPVCGRCPLSEPRMFNLVFKMSPLMGAGRGQRIRGVPAPLDRVHALRAE